ncbi:N5-carboxyaminoimidazole ribonucleotide synthase [Halomicronema hongdechloris C2206]|uniref:N5-carboxyaminoimidazole ribonucleotide synthase n=1 Tax=Halomicronema hongdechloris C2206 TaxID=1641165 RepID=A0A1Z3HFX9_9CYAN|nr:5-(carboxyamino)imidazole ribonucleotide synthase [Halomicronema hongdechloris]ASC69204.1 N5-carboxyaminoimidazole ribonucleotide synthase [Halomicronema hongdechloris C2206]
MVQWPQTGPSGPTQPRRIGVIGGGQLAWMMGPAAETLGLELVVQTGSQQDPAVAIAADTILVPVADAQGTRALAAQCDVVTFENEFIDLAALKALAAEGVIFYPQLSVLAPVLDKYDQRQYYQHIGLPNPPYVPLTSPADLSGLAEQADTIGFPLVMKTRRLGYDGYGTFILKTLDDLQAAWAQTGYAPVLLEAFIPFTKELAVMVARSVSGEIAVYPTVETQQVDQVCRRVMAPAAVAPEVHQQVEHIARTLVERLQAVGILGLEFFLTPDNRVLINEMAPRPHNSGHYTLDACVTSQFEQQLRAICDRTLGPTTLTCAQAVMVNLLGFEHGSHDYQPQRQQLAAIPHAHVYWYGKAESRPGRKLGHITVCLEAEADPREIIQQIEAIWYPR